MKHATKNGKSRRIGRHLFPAVATIAALVAGAVHAQQAAKPAAKAEDSEKLEVSP